MAESASIYGTVISFSPPIRTNFKFPSNHLAPSRLSFPRKLPSSYAASRKITSESKLPHQPTDSITESNENEIVSETPKATKGRRKSRQVITSEEAAVKDFIQKRLDETLTSISQQNQSNNHIEAEEAKVKTRRKSKKNMAVDEETPNWPLDSEIGWGIRASEYFEKHAIKNVVDEEGVEVDWEGEIDEAWVQEINCLEWESFAFHPSPLVVLVFERYNNVSINWKTLKELEKAAQVYWRAKDRLPPRMVKLDINIEKDLAYALKVRDCPAVLFLRGHRVLYRETECRNADEFVQMIAHFYYNAKRPVFLNSDGR